MNSVEGDVSRRHFLYVAAAGTVALFSGINAYPAAAEKGESFLGLHGYNGDPDSNWFRTLREQLLLSGTPGEKISMPFLQGGELPKLGSWRLEVDKSFNKLTRPVIGIAYSLGGRVMLDRLALNPDFFLDGLVLVAARDLSTNNKSAVDPRIRHFYDEALNPAVIRNKVRGGIVVIHSVDDIVVTYDDELNSTPALCRDLRAELLTLQNQGHCGGPGIAAYVMQAKSLINS